MIIDENLNDKQIRGKAKLSCLWLTGNNKFDLQELSKQIQYKTIIIDATNKDYKIVAFKAFAENNGIPSYILKKNPAYLINLTQ